MYSKNIPVINTAVLVKNKKRCICLSAFLSIGLFLTTSGTVEAQNYMVCQTPAFWCAIPGKAPNGYPCYCNTMYGSIGGTAIDPAPYNVPNPEQVDDDDEEVNIDEGTADCLNGLGECKGKFKSAVKKKKRKRNN